MNIFVVFDLTWKVQFFSAKKDFLKQHCAQDGMLQSRSQHLLFGKKVGNIGPFLMNFSHKLEHYSWCPQHPCLDKNACKKTIMLFVSQHSILIPIIPSKQLLLFQDKHLLSSKKCYLDTIWKLKLGQRLGRYH